MRWVVRLPWYDPRLSPNARVHHMALANAKKAARQIARLEAMAQGVRALPNDSEPTIKTTFHPPDQRRRDIDNCIAATKAMRDGIADALGVDDSRFVLAFKPIAEPIQGGAIIITVEAA